MRSRTGGWTGQGDLVRYNRNISGTIRLKTLEELPPLPENVEEDGVQEEADLFFENFNQTFEDLK